MSTPTSEFILGQYKIGITEYTKARVLEKALSVKYV